MSGKTHITACCRVSVREADIFRLWVDYYGRHVDKVVSVIMAEPGDDTEAIVKLCSDAGVEYNVFPCPRFDQPDSLKALRELAGRSETDWIIHTDSDEFLRQLPEIQSIVEEMGARGRDHAGAWMADRLTPTGHLRNVDDLKDYAELDAAFPVRAMVTRDLARGYIYKNPVSRSPHIGNIHSPGKLLRSKAKRMLTLEHFKWRAGLEERLQKWIAHYKEVGLPFSPECQRVLNELQQHGRIRAERWKFN